jgi:hypothetical protein
MSYPESKYLLNDGKIYTAKEISKEINLGVDAVKVRLNKTRDVDQIFAKKVSLVLKLKRFLTLHKTLFIAEKILLQKKDT